VTFPRRRPTGDVSAETPGGDVSAETPDGEVSAETRPQLQQLNVEQGSAAAARAVERMLVLQFRHSALGVGHPTPVSPHAVGGRAALARALGLALGAGLRLAVGGQHRALRRDERANAALGDARPDALGREALIDADRCKLRAGEARGIDKRHEHIALVTVGLLTEAGDHAARLLIDRDLTAMERCGRCPSLPRSLASGSVNEVAVRPALR
jgi:hypothetical protein